MIALAPEQQTTNRATGLWDIVSPTRLNTWIACPLKFKFLYVDGITKPPSAALFLGRQLHRGLEYFYRHRIDCVWLEPVEVRQHIVETWGEAVAEEQVVFSSHDEEDGLQQKALGLVDAYFEQLPLDEPQPLAVEAPLRCPLVDPTTGENLGISLFGYVDLILDGPQEPIIVDFKTSARSSTPLDVTHEIQLSCYSYLYRQTFGSTESELQIRSLIKTKVPKVQTHHYPARSEAHFHRLFAIVRAYLNDLRSNRFVFRPGWTCAICDFRDSHCRAWDGC